VFVNPSIGNNNDHDRDIFVVIEGQRKICLEEEDCNYSEPAETQFEATTDNMETLVQVLPIDDEHYRDQNDRHRGDHDGIDVHDSSVTTKRKIVDCDDNRDASPLHADCVIEKAHELKRVRVNFEKENEAKVHTIDCLQPAVVENVATVFDDVDVKSGIADIELYTSQHDDDATIIELKMSFKGHDEDYLDPVMLPHEDPTSYAHAHVHKRDEDQLLIEDMQSTQLPANYKFLFDDDDGDDDDGSSLQSITSNADMIENVEPSNIESSSARFQQEVTIMKSVGSSTESQK